MGLNFNTLKESVFKPNHGMEMYFDGEARNVSQSTNNFLFAFYSDNHLDFTKQFGTIHDLDATLGFRINTNSLQVDYGEAKNLPANDQYSDLEAGEGELNLLGGENGTWNWLSIYNRISYKLMDKYIINTGVSLDYSTRTGDQAETTLNINDMPIGLFYSVSAGWRLSNENFLKNLQGLDNLLLRASYGISGNNDIGNFNALPHYRTTKYRETSGLIPGTIPNESLTFETSMQYNAGLDINLWGSRTAMSVDYFMKKTEDLLIYEPIKAYLGYHYRPTNAGTVENKGWELSVFQRIIDGQKFDWDVSTDLSLISNEMLELGGDLITSFEGGEFLTRKGSPINTFYGYQFEGVFSTYEQATEANLVNDKGIAFRPGDAIYQDISGPEGEPDGVIDDNDKVTLGSPIPDYFGSISNRFAYNRWSLNVMVQFVYGHEVFNYTRYMNERMVDLSNQSDFVLKRWQSEGDETNVPRALWNDPVGNSDFSSRWIEDGSYVRLKSVRLAYTVPEKFLVFKNANFYITATNLITLDKYLGYDPEFSYSFNPMRQGIDYGLMPQYRQFLFGVKFGL
jgi:TonB-linked SusC/RagA family outer membrane protein